MPAIDSAKPADIPTANTDALTRLHISPLNPDLLKILLPPAHISAACSASYQTIQTFLENSYGFVSLPTEVAQALRKKYNGAHLRGSKMRIEEARPEKKRKRETEQDDGSKDEVKKSKKGDKRHAKLEEDTLPAVELAEGRHVKRGWTESAKEKKRSYKSKDGKSSRTKEKGELAFRTQVTDTSADSKERNGKSDKRAKSKKTVEVTEFEKTTQFPSFLKQKSVNGKKAAEFVEGKGWVDAEGSIVEAEPKSGRKLRGSKSDMKDSTPSLNKACLEPKTSSSATANDDNQDTEADANDDSSALSSSSASSASSESEASDDEPSPTTTIKSLKSPLIPSTETPTPTTAKRSTLGPFTSIPPNSTSPDSNIKPASPPPTTDKQIHPLEALFKRPLAPTTTTSASSKKQRRPAPAPINTTFAFGFDTHSPNGDDDAGDSGDEHGPTISAPPQTPFTRQDRFQRSIRSAAPTPDTAAIGRRFSFKDIGGREREAEAEADEEDEKEEEDDIADGIETSQHNSLGVPGTEGVQAQVGLQEDVPGVGDEGNPEQNEFEKHFYAHRGEYNKAWKARRREARKEVRQAENRRVGVGR